MNKKTIWVIVLIVLVVVAVWLWKSGVEAPAGPDETATTTDTEASAEPDLGADTSNDIQDQLEGINVDDVQGEFDQIDEDLQNL